MTRRLTGLTGLLVPVVALVAVLASGTWLVTQERDGRRISTVSGDRGGLDGRAGMMGSGRAAGAGMMGGAGMMDGGFGRLDGDGRAVRDLPHARARAERFAKTLGPGLRAGEVMQFANNYYAELEGPGKSKATEVLVDPRTGAVQLEFGPAMMWNTRFGMMASGPGSDARLSAAQARVAAERWLRARGGLTAGEAEAFPGYYTLHALRDGRIDGMLSVHAVTGAVWYHGWHGRFLKMSGG